MDQHKFVSEWSWKNPTVERRISSRILQIGHEHREHRHHKVDEANEKNLPDLLDHPANSKENKRRISFSERFPPSRDDNFLYGVGGKQASFLAYRDNRIASISRSLPAKKSILKKDQQDFLPKSSYTTATSPQSNKLYKSNSFSGFESRKSLKIRKVKPIQKNIPRDKYVYPKGAAVRDDEYPIDMKGNPLDVPIKFYRTTVKKQQCTNDDLNEIFADKFRLNDWAEYFGRTVIVTCYLYMIVCVIMLTITLGLFTSQSSAQALVRLDVKHDLKGPITLITCTVLNLILSITVYITVLQCYLRLIPYILHCMAIISIFFLASACWISKEWVSPSQRDYASLFLATTMRDVEPDFLHDVWPTIQPDIWESIQETYFCCGYNSPDDWLHLSAYHKPTIHPSCCINTENSGVPSKCKDAIKEWENDHENMTKWEEVKSLISPEPCKEILQHENNFYMWDLKLYPFAFFVVHTGILFVVTYLLDRYMREMNLWDGEIRMKLYRQNHKNYLKYLVECFKYRLNQILCSCCFERVSPVKPPCPVIGPPTHFEIWHTESGDIINVVEITPEKEEELEQFGLLDEELEGYLDLNELDSNSMNDMDLLSYDRLRKSSRKSVTFGHPGRWSSTRFSVGSGNSRRKSSGITRKIKERSSDYARTLGSMYMSGFDVGPYFAKGVGHLSLFSREKDDDGNIHRFDDY